MFSMMAEGQDSFLAEPNRMRQPEFGGLDQSKRSSDIDLHLSQLDPNFSLSRNQTQSHNFMPSASSATFPSGPKPPPTEYMSDVREGKSRVVDDDDVPMQNYTAPTEGVWVTVFGFPPELASAVLERCYQCGEIVEFQNTESNFMNLKYVNTEQASMALQLNGRMVSGVMIGVVPCTLPTATEPTSTLKTGAQQRVHVTPTTVHLHTLQTDPSGMMPYADKSVWSRVRNYILGY